MFTLPIRGLLFAIALVLSYLTDHLYVRLGYLAASIVLAVGYLRSGTVALAFQALRSGSLPQARRLLAQTRFPNWLSAQSRAYREWMLGIFALDEKRWTNARDHLQSAVEHGLRTPNDRSLAEGYLALALFHCGDVPAAHQRLTSAKEGMAKPEGFEVLEQIEHAMSAGPESKPIQ